MLEQGWAPGADRDKLGPCDPDYADRRAPASSLEELRAAMDESRAVWREFIGSGIDTRTGIGFHQIYGGVGGEFSVGRHCSFTLANEGETRVELLIRRLPETSQVYPLTLTPTFNGVPGEAREVFPPGDDDAVQTVTFEVPASVRDNPYLDVQVDSSSWRMLILKKRRTLLSYYFTAARLAR